MCRYKAIMTLTQFMITEYERIIFVRLVQRETNAFPQKLRQFTLLFPINPKRL